VAFLQRELGRLPDVVADPDQVVPLLVDGSERLFAEAIDLLRDERFWTKICSVDKISRTPIANVPDGIPFKDVIPFARAVIAAAPDRVIWGTDWPHGNTFTPGRVPNEGALLDLLGEIAPDEETRRRILVDNPARLYGFA